MYKLAFSGIVVAATFWWALEFEMYARAGFEGPAHLLLPPSPSSLSLLVLPPVLVASLHLRLNFVGGMVAVGGALDPCLQVGSVHVSCYAVQCPDRRKLCALQLLRKRNKRSSVLWVPICTRMLEFDPL